MLQGHTGTLTFKVATQMLRAKHRLNKANRTDGRRDGGTEGKPLVPSGVNTGRGLTTMIIECLSFVVFLQKFKLCHKSYSGRGVNMKLHRLIILFR